MTKQRKPAWFFAVYDEILFLGSRYYGNKEGALGYNPIHIYLGVRSSD